MDYYKILELTSDAKKSEIREAYKKLALKYHPDRNKNGSEMFKQVSDAYQVLSDDSLRRKYDLNKDFIFHKKNPHDILESFFNNIQDYNIKSIIKSFFKSNEYDINNYSFDILYKYVLNYIKLNNKYVKNKFKNIYIDVDYDLMEHFEYNFLKDVYLEINHKTINKKLKYQIDTRKKYHFFKQKIYKDQLLLLELNIHMNVNAYTLPQFKIIDEYTLLYYLNISIENYLEGFYYLFKYFNKNILFHFKNINTSNLLFKIENMGIPLNDNTCGDLYIKLILSKDNHIHYNLLPKEKVIEPLAINFF